MEFYVGLASSSLMPSPTPNHGYMFKIAGSLFNWRPTSKQDHLPLLDEDSKWYRVTIYEAQCIKKQENKRGHRLHWLLGNGSSFLVRTAVDLREDEGTLDSLKARRERQHPGHW